MIAGARGVSGVVVSGILADEGWPVSNSAVPGVAFAVVFSLLGIARAAARQQARREREREQRRVKAAQTRGRPVVRDLPQAPPGFEGPWRSPTVRPPLRGVTPSAEGPVRTRSGMPPGQSPRSAPREPVPLPRATATPAAAESQDARPSRVDVPARLFSRAARMAVRDGRVDASALRERLGVDRETADTLLLALEGAGITGAPPLRRVLVEPGGLSAALARFGLVEDEEPPSPG